MNNSFFKIVSYASILLIAICTIDLVVALKAAEYKFGKKSTYVLHSFPTPITEKVEINAIPFNNSINMNLNLELPTLLN